MAKVHRVLDEMFERTLALKVLHLKHSPSPEQRERFKREAWLTARLQHPGIVPLHESGVLDDGRPWFLMKEIRGQRLREQMPRPEDAARPWNQRDIRPILENLLQVCEAVAHAHSVGVLHRDLKPENVMLGEFGVAYVLDWGIARWLHSDLLLPHASNSSVSAKPLSTRHGRVMGTPPYMSPEQADANRDQIGPWTDVYALGAMLYEILAGLPLYVGGTQEIWMQIRTGPPTPLSERLPPHAQPPPDLLALVNRAIASAPADRYPNANVLAQALKSWLAGARREDQARAVLDQSAMTQRGFRALLGKAEDMEQKAEVILETLETHDPSDRKEPAWLLQEQARLLRRQAVLEAAHYEQQLQSALQIAPNFEAAHTQLAAFYWERAKRAETRRDIEALAYNEQRLRTHDRGKFAGWLHGNGRLTLVTDPPGASVVRRTWLEHRRRLVLGPPTPMGQTPLEDISIPRGSHLLEIRAPGSDGPPIRYPVFIPRGAHWDGVRPGEHAPYPIRLPAPDAFGPDDLYVPAGWFQSGGDPEATDGLAARQIWVDDFVIQRHPITHREYLVFLNDLVANCDVDEALRCAPRETNLVSEKPRLLYHRRADDGFALKESEGSARQGLDGFAHQELNDPVIHIDWKSVWTYARWWAAKTGHPWRLPEDLEWEKAARGVDGRCWPWGDRLEPTWTNMSLTHAGPPSRSHINTYPIDESPYNVRGMAGNVRDWCNNGYRRKGLPADRSRVIVQPCSDDEPYRMIRGGAWNSIAASCRSAMRLVARPGDRLTTVGFRLVYSQ